MRNDIFNLRKSESIDTELFNKLSDAEIIGILKAFSQTINDNFLSAEIDNSLIIMNQSLTETISNIKTMKKKLFIIELNKTIEEGYFSKEACLNLYDKLNQRKIKSDFFIELYSKYEINIKRESRENFILHLKKFLNEDKYSYIEVIGILKYFESKKQIEETIPYINHFKKEVEKKAKEEYIKFLKEKEEFIEEEKLKEEFFNKTFYFL